MLFYANAAKFEFVWPDGSDFVEVYHNSAAYPDAPIEAVLVNDLPRSRESLKKLAKAPEYNTL